MDSYILIEIQEELAREKWFENQISEQKNIPYLKGFYNGLKKRKDMPLSEKKYYCSLVEQRIQELK